MIKRYCIIKDFKRIPNSLPLKSSQIFWFLKDLSSAYEIYQLCDGSIPRILNQQRISKKILAKIANSYKVPYCLKSDSLKEWMAFELYSWMNTRCPDSLLMIEGLNIYLYISSHIYIEVLASYKEAFSHIEPILRKYDFILVENIPHSSKIKRLMIDSKKIPDKKMKNLISISQYKLLLEYYQLEYQSYSPNKEYQRYYLEFLEKNTFYFYLTLWDHWIKDEETFGRYILEYGPNSLLLKTSPSKMRRKVAYEGKLLEFILWLFDHFECYKILFKNDKVMLYAITKQEVINRFYMSAREGRGNFDLYFPQLELIVSDISESYSMRLTPFKEDEFNLKKQALEMGLYALR